METAKRENTEGARVSKKYREKRYGQLEKGMAAGIMNVGK